MSSILILVVFELCDAISARRRSELPLVAVRRDGSPLNLFPPSAGPTLGSEIRVGMSSGLLLASMHMIPDQLHALRACRDV